MSSRAIRRPRRRWPWILVVLVLIASSGGAVWHYDLIDRYLVSTPDPALDPALVEPPAGLSLPTPAAAPAVADPATPTATLSQTAVKEALAKGLADEDLGSHRVALVAPLTGRGTTYTTGSGTITPASTLKLLTGAAAIESLGAQTTFATTVVRAASKRIVLVGGGDPYLASEPVAKEDAEQIYPERADLQTLARRTAVALKRDGMTRVRLAYDDSLFSGPTLSPTWKADYYPGEVSHISALWADQGQNAQGTARTDQPALAAATIFAEALRDEGIEVRGEIRAGRAQGASIAEVRSAPVAQIVQRVIEVSDNNGAEVLAHHVGLAEAQDGSFEGGVTGVSTALIRLGLPMGAPTIKDGSGLDRGNRIPPIALIALLRSAASEEHPELRPILEGLPVAGFSGSLSSRFDTGPKDARGRVRAKTGTLSGVTALAGLAQDAEGNLMAFVLAADRVPADKGVQARTALDEAAAALGACRCG